MVQTLTGDNANDNQKPNCIQPTEHGNISCLCGLVPSSEMVVLYITYILILHIAVKQARQYQYIKHITSVADHTLTNILYGQGIDVRYIFYNIVMHKVNTNMVVQNLTNTRLKC